MLILGGGDGMAVREILKYPDVETITLVDLDPEMTRLFHDASRSAPPSTSIRFSIPSVHVINADAFIWLGPDMPTFDFVVVDFPDPSNYSLGKLYSTAFYRCCATSRPRGRGRWSRARRPMSPASRTGASTTTLRAAGFATTALPRLRPVLRRVGLRARLDSSRLRSPSDTCRDCDFVNHGRGPEMMTYFPPDMARVPTGVNRLNNQVLVQYFDDEWADYAH